MSKKITFGENAILKTQVGANIAGKTVRQTLGSKGRNTTIDTPNGFINTNDGYFTILNISLEDEHENLGVKILRKVAIKVNELEGDATSTSITLADEILNQGVKFLKKGMNMIEVKRGMENTTKEAVDILNSMSKKITKFEEIKQVATISAEDKTLGKVIAETVKKVGEDGKIDAEITDGKEIKVDMQNGIEIESGMMFPMFMLTNPHRIEAEYKDAPVLFTDMSIDNFKMFGEQHSDIFRKLISKGTPYIVLVCKGLKGEAIQLIPQNRQNGFAILAVKAPEKDKLQDLATLSGGRFIAEATDNLDNVKFEDLGYFGTVLSTRSKTIFRDGKGKKKDIDLRIKQLKGLEEPPKERIAELKNSRAVIKVPVKSESDMERIKYKVEDAVFATKRAIKNGIVIGGGSALAKASQLLTEPKQAEHKVGYEIIKNAMQEPLKQIAINGNKNGELILDKVLSGGKYSGYNASTDKIVDNMFKEGIIDPISLETTSLEIATSEISTFLITGAIITNKPKKDD